MIDIPEQRETRRYEFLIFDRRYKQAFFDSYEAATQVEALALARKDYPFEEYEVKS